jgi:transcriptional regulator GlxA family with amidase domain
VVKSVAFVLFEGVEELDFVGPWEVFTMAGSVVAGEVNAFTVAQKAGIVTCAKGLRVVADHSFEDCPPADIVLVPGGMATRREVDNPTLIEFLRRMNAQSEFTTSVCTGALLLERAGVLQGLHATTHWGALPELKATGVETLEDTRFVDNGRVITSSGVSAGIDMALHLVGRIWGPKVAMTTQKYMEYYPDPPKWE